MNDRQYRTTLAQVQRFEEALLESERGVSLPADIDPRFAEIHRAALRSELKALLAEVKEYEDLKEGRVEVLTAPSLRELPSILIKARIARGMTQADLANLLNVKEQQVQRYEAEQYRAAPLHRLIEVSDALGIEIAESASLKPHGAQSTSEKIEWDRFPIREMYQRGWFEDFAGTAAQAKKHADTLMPMFFVNAGTVQPQAALHRKYVRANSTLNEYALVAWEARVSALAATQDVPGFDRENLSDQWVDQLVSLSAERDSLQKVGSCLKSVGIRFVAEPHLAQTHLDGASLVIDGNKPVVAVTARHDRLDNFWFVLLHEIGHIKRHFEHLLAGPIFDDVESPSTSQIEEEADEFAQEALIPSDFWKTAASRFFRTEAAIKSDAEKLGVSPSIVAGRIRREANDYTLFPNLVGRNEVRKVLFHSY